jgi:hypothetical protein
MYKNEIFSIYDDGHFYGIQINMGFGTKPFIYIGSRGELISFLEKAEGGSTIHLDGWSGEIKFNDLDKITQYIERGDWKEVLNIIEAAGSEEASAFLTWSKDTPELFATVIFYLKPHTIETDYFDICEIQEHEIFTTPHRIHAIKNVIYDGVYVTFIEELKKSKLRFTL